MAAGRRAVYVTDGDLRGSVHFANGIALCQGAGCVVTDIHGQPPDTGAREVWSQLRMNKLAPPCFE